ncbi:hypothetical protein [Haloplanus natans]|uniref:hypothetical protein n=1 Tax=Haloplanus natans TaxID=376171 RepID=UPI0006780155|nr:hypothetical protein [Haloplanus natans]
MAATELHISGGNHITLPSRRKKSKADNFDRLDIIFVEAPLSKRPGKLEQLANLATVPLLITAIYIILLGQKFFQVLGLHDSHIVYDLAEEYDAEIIEVDMDLFDVIAEYRLLWMFLHHGIVVLAILALPTLADAAQWIPVSAAVSSVFVAAAVLIFGAFAIGTMPARDAQMAYDIKEYAEENRVDDALLVIGALHHSGIQKCLQDSEHIQLA